MLLCDPGFQLHSLEFMLGGSIEDGAAGNQSESGEKIFDFRNFECILQ